MNQDIRQPAERTPWRRKYAEERFAHKETRKLWNRETQLVQALDHKLSLVPRPVLTVCEWWDVVTKRVRG